MFILCCFFVVTLNLISVYVEFVKICTPEVRWDEESPNDLVAEAAADPRAAIDEARRTAAEGGPKLAKFVNFWRARSRLYQNVILQENMRLTAFSDSTRCAHFCTAAISKF